MVDDQLCVSKPGTPYTFPSSTTALAPITATTAATVPTDVAVGTNTNCGKYYTAVSGDYCNLVILKFGISLDDFLFLNTAVNSNCTNLYAEESYCVEAVGDINTYSGMPGYATYTATITTLVSDLATTWPTIDYTTPTATTTALPLASGTRDDCWQYFNGSKYIGKAAGSSLFTSDCDFAAQVFSMSLEDLGVWNPCEY